VTCLHTWLIHRSRASSWAASFPKSFIYPRASQMTFIHLILNPQMSPIWPQKSPIYPPKSPIYLSKNSISKPVHKRSLSQKSSHNKFLYILAKEPYINLPDKILQCGETRLLDPHYPHSDSSDEPYSSTTEISSYISWLDKIRQWGEGMFFDPHYTYSDPSDEPYLSAKEISLYGVATISRLLKMIGLFFRIRSLL